MSIVDSTIPAASAGFAPIDCEVQVSRMTPDTEAITAIADGDGAHAGTTRLTVAALGYFETADCITISGATGTAEWINGRHDIHVTNNGATKYIYIETAYQSVTTGDLGTITRSNGSVKVKTEIVINSVAVATFYSYPAYEPGDANYQVHIDLSPFIQPYFSSDFRLTAGVVSDSGAGSLVTYTVNFYEMHQKADYTYMTSAAEQQTGLKAFRTVSYSDRIVNDSTAGEDQFLTDIKTNIYRTGDFVILNAICTEASAWLRIERDNAIPPVSYTEIATVRDNLILIVIDTDTYGGADFNVSLQNNTGEEGLTWQSEKIYYVNDARCYKYPKLLYFLNRYGGWDIYNFREINEDRLTAEKIQTRNFQTVQNTKRQLKLVGRPETYASMAILSDLITSPEVYDSTGAQVRIKESEIAMRKGEDIIIPEITIEYYENEFIY